MSSIASSADVRRLFATSILARLPLAMLSIGLVVHTQHLTGSFAAAGMVTGVYAIGEGVGGPLLGQLVDRRGQTSVLLASAGVAAVLLIAMAVLPAGAPLVVLVAIAAGIGLATPPVGSCLRTQLPALLPDPSASDSAYAFEASVVELTWILGPPLVLCIAAFWSTGAALAIAGLVLVVATAAFAAQPASRGWQPASADRRASGGSLRTPAMRTLVIVLIAVGVLLGAAEVAVTAAAKTLDDTAVAAPLFALWGAGSFAGGLLTARLGGVRTATGLTLVLCALSVGHLALIPAAGSVVALGGVLFLAGATIAPTEASVYAMVDHAASQGTMTEAFAWLATAIAVGSAAGAATAGVLIDRAGPTAAFALAGCAGGLAALTATLRSRTLIPEQARVIADTDTVPRPTSSWSARQPLNLQNNRQPSPTQIATATRAISKDATEIDYAVEPPRPRPAGRSDRQPAVRPARRRRRENRITSVDANALGTAELRLDGWSRWCSRSQYRSFSTTGCARRASAPISPSSPVPSRQESARFLRLISNRTADGWQCS